MQSGPYNVLTTAQPARPEAAQALREGDAVDRYVVVGWLGEGGVATVFRVRHTTLNTAYALKVLKIPRPDLRERLLREGRLQAALQHPHIVRVHDVLTVHGSPALVLDLIEGPSLRALLAGGPLEADALYRVARALSSALQYAHARGVVHRDLKPANILVTQGPEGPTPFITDFGIARLLEVTPEASTTLTGGILGTLAYMAPEQLRCSKNIGPAADIFSLGVILYELACGQRPFEAVEGDPVAMAQAISAGAYPALEGRRAGLRPTFYEAVAGCLRESALERPTAAQLHALLALEPAVSAPPLPARKRSPLWAVAGMSGVMVAAAVVAKPVLMPMASAPVAPAVQGVQAARADEDVVAAARLEASAWRVARRDAGQAVALLRAAAALDPAQAPRLLDVLQVARLEREGGAVRVLPHSEQVLGVSADSAGERLATATLSGGVYMWEVKTGRLLWKNEEALDAQPSGVHFINDAEQLLVVPKLNASLSLKPRPVVVLDARTGAVRHTFAHGGVTSMFELSPDRRWGLTMGQDARVQLWDLRTGAPSHTLRRDGFQGNDCAAFSPDGAWLAIGSVGQLMLYRTDTWTHERTLGTRSADRYCALLFEDANQLLHTTRSGLKRWDVRTGALVRSASHTPHTQLTLSPGGARLLEQDERGAVLTDSRTLERVAALRGHQGRVMGAVWSSDGRQVLTASSDHTAKLWDGVRGHEQGTLRGHTSWVFAATWLGQAEQRVAATAGRDRTVRLWQLWEGQPTALAAPEALLDRVALSPSWDEVMALVGDTMWRWRLTGGVYTQLDGIKANGEAKHAFSANGVWRARMSQSTSSVWREGEPAKALPAPRSIHGLLRVTNDGEVIGQQGPIIYRARGGEASWREERYSEQLDLFQMTDDGALIVAASDIHIFTSRGGQITRADRGFSRPSAILIEPDGRHAWLSTWPGDLERWQLEPLRLVKRVKGHEDAISRAKLRSARGELITVGLDRTIKRWSADLKVLGQMTGHETDILGIALSPDERLLATSDKDGMVIVWEVETGRALHVRWAPSAVYALRFEDAATLDGMDQDNTRWRWRLGAERAAWTNLRVCRGSERVVPVVPYPTDDAPWAPEELCR